MGLPALLLLRAFVALETHSPAKQCDTVTQQLNSTLRQGWPRQQRCMRLQCIAARERRQEKVVVEEEAKEEEEEEEAEEVISWEAPCRYTEVCLGL